MKLDLNLPEVGHLHFERPSMSKEARETLQQHIEFLGTLAFVLIVVWLLR